MSAATSCAEFETTVAPAGTEYDDGGCGAATPAEGEPTPDEELPPEVPPVPPLVPELPPELELPPEPGLPPEPAVGGCGGGAGACTVHDATAVVCAPRMEAVTLSECFPTPRPVSVSGVEHDDARPPSSEHLKLAPKVACQESVAVVEVVPAGGVDVNVSVSGVGDHLTGLSASRRKALRSSMTFARLAGTYAAAPLWIPIVRLKTATATRAARARAA